MSLTVNLPGGQTTVLNLQTTPSSGTLLAAKSGNLSVADAAVLQSSAGPPEDVAGQCRPAAGRLPRRAAVPSVADR